MKSMIENKNWRVADQAAALLSIDREVCRRAFYKESEERVSEVVRWVVSESDLPRYEPEQMIEQWAREHSAGIYSQNHRHADLEHIEEIVVQAVLRRDVAA